MNQPINTRKWMLLISWPVFFGVAVACITAVALAFACLYVAFETLESSDRAITFVDAAAYSFAIIVGSATPSDIQNNAPLVGTLETASRFVLFPTFVGFLLARMAKARNRAKFARRAACHVTDAGGVRLEFRLIVYPSAAIYIQEIVATISLISTDGGRENLPLTLEPIRAVRVAYYLVFRAVLPDVAVNSESGQTTVPKITPSAVEVYVKAIDSASDEPVFIHHEYLLPDHLTTGFFMPAVRLSSTSQITGVEKQYLEKIGNKEQILRKLQQAKN